MPGRSRWAQERAGGQPSVAECQDSPRNSGRDWESKWQDMETDLLEAVHSELGASLPALPGSQRQQGAVSLELQAEASISQARVQQRGRDHSARAAAEEAPRSTAKAAARQSAAKEAPGTAAAALKEGKQPPRELHGRRSSRSPATASASSSEAASPSRSASSRTSRSSSSAESRAASSKSPRSPEPQPQKEFAQCPQGESKEPAVSPADDLVPPRSPQSKSALAGCVEEVVGSREEEAPLVAEGAFAVGASHWSNLLKADVFDVVKPDKEADEEEEERSTTAETESCPGLVAATPQLRGLRCVWRFWYALLALSLVEAVLLAAATLLDRLWSPCREPLRDCHGLHRDECSGAACYDAAPIWGPAWPLAGLLFSALPVRAVLRGKAGGDAWIVIGLIVTALAVAGLGVAVLVNFTSTGLRYVARCPMPRASGRCVAELCPTPPCRRERETSPCVCGLVSETEMARALFLKGFAACRPYEWFPSQMSALEVLVLDYEGFACIVAPLACATLVVGGLLLLLQLSCCPLLLLGNSSLENVLLVFFASDEELDRLVVKEVPAANAKGKAGKH